MRLQQRFLKVIVGQIMQFASDCKLLVSQGGANAPLEGNAHAIAGVGRQPAAPLTATNTATLSAAQMLSGILVCTPTAAAAYTTQIGSAIEAAHRAIRPNLQVGDAFDLTIINIGATTLDITLTAGASGVTIVGDAVVRPSADSATEQAGQGTFRFRRSAADTYVAYRVS